jgi:hypothetical protein
LPVYQILHVAIDGETKKIGGEVEVALINGPKVRRFRPALEFQLFLLENVKIGQTDCGCDGDRVGEIKQSLHQ